MGRNCEVFECTNNDGRNSQKSFYKFPKCEHTCRLWVRFCCSKELYNLFQASGTEAVSKRKICSDHFPTEGFLQPDRKDRGVRKGVIPTIRDPSQVQTNINNDFDMYRENVENHHEVNNEEKSQENITQDEYMDIEFLDEEFLCEKDLLETSSEMKNDNENKDEHSNTFGAPVYIEPDFMRDQLDFNYDKSPAALYKAELCTIKEKCRILEKQVKHLKIRLHVADTRSKRRAVSIKHKNDTIRKLKDEIKELKVNTKVDSKVLVQLKNNPVLYDSLKNMNRPPRGRRYSRPSRKFAVSSYLSGPRTYRCIQRSKVLCLPTKRSIKKWTQEVELKPGLNAGLLRRVAEKTKDFSDADRVVILAIDGMRIKSSLSYTAKNDRFHGFPDSGTHKRIERNNPRKLATEAVTVMIRGVNKNFKQGLGYFLTFNTLGSEEQKEIVENSIRTIRNAGLHPVLLAMDQFATNLKMAKELGVTTDNPYFSVDGKKVFIMWDTPHLIKNTRNMLKKHNAVFDNKIASFQDLEKLYEIDSQSDLRLVPRLTEKHITVPPFSPMNVSLATRTLSQSVAAGMRYYTKTGELDQRALQTCEFVEMHDKLFDIFNSKREVCSGKPFKGAIKTGSCHWNFLLEAKEILSHMYYTSKSCLDITQAPTESQNLTAAQRHPNYVRGFLNNINALILLWDHLENEYGFKFLCTNRGCQDCLENLFSEIRRRCGGNDTPDALQFGAAFKYACVEASSKIQGTNCERDNDLTLLNEDDTDTVNITITDPVQSHRYKLSPLNISENLEISAKELNALIYILGATVRKLPHAKCVSKLKLGQDESPNDEMYNFCHTKANVTGRDHILANTNLYSIGILCFAVFKQKFRKFLFQNRNGVKGRMKEYLDHSLFGEFVCERCFNVIIDKVFNTFIQGFLKQTKASNAKNTKTKKKFKRNRKAARMCLPL